jgi:hypothetical protein
MCGDIRYVFNEESRMLLWDTEALEDATQATDIPLEFRIDGLHKTDKMAVAKVAVLRLAPFDPSP